VNNSEAIIRAKSFDAGQRKILPRLPERSVTFNRLQRHSPARSRNWIRAIGQLYPGKVLRPLPDAYLDYNKFAKTLLAQRLRW